MNHCHVLRPMFLIVSDSARLPIPNPPIGCAIRDAAAVCGMRNRFMRARFMTCSRPKPPCVSIAAAIRQLHSARASHAASSIAGYAGIARYAAATPERRQPRSVNERPTAASNRTPLAFVCSAAAASALHREADVSIEQLRAVGIFAIPSLRAQNAFVGFSSRQSNKQSMTLG